MQLRVFENYLEKAIMHNITPFYVIHGFGKGRLKEEVFKILERYQEVEKFENPFHPKYGWGATQVYLR